MTFEKIAMVVIFLAVLLAVQTYLYTRYRSNPKTQASDAAVINEPLFADGQKQSLEISQALLNTSLMKEAKPKMTIGKRTKEK